MLVLECEERSNIQRAFPYSWKHILFLDWDTCCTTLGHHECWLQPWWKFKIARWFWIWREWKIRTSFAPHCTRLVVTKCEMLIELFGRVSTQLNTFIGNSSATEEMLEDWTLGFSRFQNNNCIRQPQWLIPAVLHHDKIGVTQTKLGVELVYLVIW